MLPGACIGAPRDPNVLGSSLINVGPYPVRDSEQGLAKNITNLNA